MAWSFSKLLDVLAFTCGWLSKGVMSLSVTLEGPLFMQAWLFTQGWPAYCWQWLGPWAK